MSSPSEGIKDLLVASSVGVFKATSGWGIFIGREPSEPDKVITIYDIGGRTPDPKWLLDYPSIQVRVRGAQDGYVAAIAKAKQVKDVLLGLDAQTINSDGWRSLLMVGDIVHIGFDVSNRPMFTANYDLIIEPQVPAITNRERIS